MEKKYQQPYSSKNVSTDLKKSQDTNNAKHFPKSFRKGNFSKNDQPRKFNAQKTKTFGKILPKFKGQYNGCSKEESKVVVNEAELGSVMAKGNKKQNKNGNHLLEYNFPPRGGGGYNSHHQNQWYSVNRRRKYDKDQFLQANCQFVVTANGDYSKYENVDKLVDWELIQQILMQSSENVLCPICLHPPVAGKMTRCGHIYCWPCILTYLSFSENSGTKCPVCYSKVYKSGLKSAKVIVNKSTLNVGDTITFRLMCREKKSLIAMPVCDTSTSVQFLSISDEFCLQTYSKLLLAERKDIENILNVEKNELDNELAMQKNIYPDSNVIPFIEQALMELNDRVKLLDDIYQNERKLNQLTINEAIDFEKQENAHGNTESIYGDHKNMLNYIHDKNMTSKNQGTPSEPQKFYYFYQAENGQNVYLYTLNVKMLEAQYGSLENSPQIISGRLLEREVDSLTEETRSRMRYLGHLPVTSQIEFLEIDLRSFVSKKVIENFEEQLKKRRTQREHNERKERKREKKIAENQNKLMGKFDPFNVEINSPQHFPEIQPESELNEFNFPSSPPIRSPLSSTSSSPVVDTTFDELVSVTRRESSVCSSSSNQVQSFAQMVQKSNSVVWPSLKTSVNKVEATFVSTAVQPVISIDPEMEEYMAPVNNPNLSDAIVQAFQNKKLLKKEGAKNGNITDKKKKKKPKATVLFATNMARAS